MKKTLTILIVFAVVGSFALSGTASAESNKCSDDMAITLAMTIYQNKEELKVSDEQIAKIKELKIAYKKEMVQKKADIKVKGIDIKALLWEDDIDLAKVNGLIDEKYDMKKEKSKLKLSTYVHMKNILNKEQQEALEVVCKKSCPQGKRYSEKKSKRM
jgi:Spy/CpxP family protein refolding chaperone